LTSCSNISIGYFAHGSSPSGNGVNKNVAIGECAGQFQTGSFSVHLGFKSGHRNANYHNITLGCYAGACNTCGCGNFYAGIGAGMCANVGVHNVVIGSYSYTNATGSCNIVIGWGAGLRVTGCRNTFIGQAAGRCTTGGYNNVFVGCYVGWQNTTGKNNTFIGDKAGCNNVTGINNTGIGQFAGSGNTSGTYNTFVGHGAGCNNTRGNNNIFIGCFSGTSSGPANITTECGRILMGNYNHTCAQIQIAWTAVSDCRDKCIYGRVPHGRGFLQNIEPIEYAFKNRLTGAITDPEGKRRYGFSAQNVLAAEGDAPVVVSADNPDKLQITSDYMVPILVNAVNELSAEIEALKARIAVLESQ
jgi:hypothetical protein